MKTGIEIIAEARRRQVEKLGYDAPHDDLHDSGELIAGAIAFASLAQAEAQGYSPTDGANIGFDFWPWEAEQWNPSLDQIENLANAGALIAAEIDRRTRGGIAAHQPERTPLPGKDAEVLRVKVGILKCVDFRDRLGAIHAQGCPIAWSESNGLFSRLFVVAVAPVGVPSVLRAISELGGHRMERVNGS